MDLKLVHHDQIGLAASRSLVIWITTLNLSLEHSFWGNKNMLLQASECPRLQSSFSNIANTKSYYSLDNNCCSEIYGHPFVVFLMDDRLNILNMGHFWNICQWCQAWVANFVWMICLRLHQHLCSLSFTNLHPTPPTTHQRHQVCRPFGNQFTFTVIFSFLYLQPSCSC